MTTRTLCRGSDGPPSPQPLLERVIVTEDGRIRATFSDNSLLLLNASGAAFIVVGGEASNQQPLLRTQQQQQQQSQQQPHQPPSPSPSPVPPETCQQQQQLCDYCLSRSWPRLAAVLQFRNQHLDIPSVCAALRRAAAATAGKVFSLGYRVAEVWWPETADAALRSGLASRQPDGSIELHALDRTCRLTLHPTRRRFAVSYPLLLSEPGSSTDITSTSYSRSMNQQYSTHPFVQTSAPNPSRSYRSGAGGTAVVGFQYTWHVQVFSTAHFPPRWLPAVDLVLELVGHWRDGDDGGKANAPSPAAAGCASHGTFNALRRAAVSTGQQLQLVDPAGDEGSQHDLSPTHTTRRSSRRTLLPVPPTSRPTSRHICGTGGTNGMPDNTRRPAGDDPPAADLAAPFPSGSWWYERDMSLYPQRDVVVLEWTRDVLVAFHPHSGEVEAWLAVDDSCLSSVQHGRFLVHTRGPNIPQQMFAASCVPEWIFSSSNSSSGSSSDAATTVSLPARYRLGPIAARALHMRDQMTTGCMEQAAGAIRRPADTVPQAGSSPVTARPPCSVAESFAVVSEAVLHSCSAAGVGSFTLFKDGRAHAMFCDRTILHTNRDATHCQLYLPDGSSVLVATHNPIGVTQYVQAVQDFLASTADVVVHRGHYGVLYGAYRAPPALTVAAEVASARSARMAALIGWQMEKTKSPSHNGVPPAWLAVSAVPTTPTGRWLEQRLLLLEDGSGRDTGGTRDQGGGRQQYSRVEWSEGGAGGADGRVTQAMVDAELRRNAELIHRLAG